MLPALRAAVKEFFSGFGSTLEPLSLDTKSFDFGIGIGLDWYNRNGYPAIYSALAGGMPAWSGENVSLHTALNHSVVWACNRIISESTAFLPLVMLQRKGDTKRVADEQPMYRCMHDAFSDEMTAMGGRETMTSHCVLEGNAYAHIIRRSGTGTALELHPLVPSQVTPDREKEAKKRLVYVVKEGTSNGGNSEKTYTVEKGKPQDILHMRGLGFDGLKGYSVISMARQSIGTAIATERNLGRFFANGGRLPYNLKLNQKFKNDADADKFRADWQKLYSNPHLTPILEPYVDYQQTGISAKDSQLLETRLFNIHEICRWFLVSPHLVGDLSRATFSNIEQLALEFVKMTLSTWIVRWEQELWRCVLTDEEKDKGFYFKHNLNSLLRGDFLSRMQGYSVMLQNGISNIDEVRDLEDWNPAPNGAGEGFHIQLNQQTLGPNGATLPATDAGLVRLGTN